MSKANYNNWIISFFKFFRLGLVLIPLSTIKTTYYVTAMEHASYVDVYVFGFRVCRFQINRP